MSLYPRVEIASNTLIQLAGKGVSAATTFLVTILLARAYGPAGYGNFTTAVTFVGFFFLFTDFGLNAVFLREYRDDRYIGNVFFIRMTGALLGMFLCTGLLFLFFAGTRSGFTDEVRTAIVLFSPAMFMQGLVMTSTVLFQRRLRYDLLVVSQLLGNAVTLFVAWWSIRNFPHLGVTGGIAAFLAGFTVAATVSLWFARRLTPIRVRFQPEIIRNLVLGSLPLGLTLISNAAYAHADTIVLALTRPASDVGSYGLAYRVFETVLVIPAFLMNAVYPYLVRVADGNGRVDTTVLIRQVAVVLLALSLLSTGAVWSIAPLVIRIRPDFSSSIPLLRILSLSFPLFFWSSLSMWMLVARRAQWFLASVYVGTMIINIALNIFFVPRLGPVASAWITVGMEAVVLGLNGLRLRRP